MNDDIFPLIRDYLAANAAGPAGDITLESRLLEGGLLDSLGILQLTEFLGERLGITVEDEDFVPDHFETVASLCAFVAGKRGG